MNLTTNELKNQNAGLKSNKETEAKKFSFYHFRHLFHRYKTEHQFLKL